MLVVMKITGFPFALVVLKNVVNAPEVSSSGVIRMNYFKSLGHTTSSPLFHFMMHLLSTPNPMLSMTSCSFDGKAGTKLMVQALS